MKLEKKEFITNEKYLKLIIKQFNIKGEKNG